MDIQLQINGAAFQLLEAIDQRKLQMAGFRPGGWLVRRAAGVEKGAVVYRAKDCEVSCLGGAFRMLPNLESMDQRCSTAAHMIYTASLLKRVQFQLTGNLTQAKLARGRFLSACEEAKGWPMPLTEPPGVHQYEDERARLTCEFHLSGEHVYITWETRP